MKKMLRKPTKDTTLLIVKAYDGEGCVNGNHNTCNASGGGCNSFSFDLGGIIEAVLPFLK